jgi:hypothetical protein
MGEVPRQKQAGSYTKPHTPPPGGTRLHYVVPGPVLRDGGPNPDLGQHLWRQGRGTRGIHIMPIIPAIVADYGKDGAEMSGAFCGDAGRFAVTVAKVPAAQVLRDTAGTREIAASGRLDSRAVAGDSGEVYRMIVGTLAPWGTEADGGAG